jgi:hypothetical protein
MEAVRSSETSVAIYKTTRRHNPEDHNRHFYRRENLRSQIMELVFLFRNTVINIYIA